MKFKKENSLIKISAFTLIELTAITKLKCRYDIYTNNEIIEVYDVDKFGIYDTNKGKFNHQDLFNKFINGIGVEFIELTNGEFKKIEPLIDIVGNISEEVINKATYFEFYDDIYIVCYHPFNNGANNILYYFDNNTFMFFDKNGPNIKTETRTTTFLDVVS